MPIEGKRFKRSWLQSTLKIKLPLKMKAVSLVVHLYYKQHKRLILLFAKSPNICQTPVTSVRHVLSKPGEIQREYLCEMSKVMIL